MLCNSCPGGAPYLVQESVALQDRARDDMPAYFQNFPRMGGFRSQETMGIRCWTCVSKSVQDAKRAAS